LQLDRVSDLQPLSYQSDIVPLDVCTDSTVVTIASTQSLFCIIISMLYYPVVGITNAEFICGKAEDVLPSLMWRLSGQEVVVVVDPPRAGLRVFQCSLL